MIGILDIAVRFNQISVGKQLNLLPGFVVATIFIAGGSALDIYLHGGKTRCECELTTSTLYRYLMTMILFAFAMRKKNQ